MVQNCASLVHSPGLQLRKSSATLQSWKTAKSALSDNQSFEDDESSTDRNTSSFENKLKEVRVKSATCYRIAHPPPSIPPRKKLRSRPGLLLQFQRTSELTRPVPAFDVVSSAALAPKLVRRFSKLSKRKTGLGSFDIVVFHRQDYTTLNAVSSNDANGSLEESTWISGEAFGVICQVQPTAEKLTKCTEICLKDGSLWEARRLQNGNYEFVCIDIPGKRDVARWIFRATRRLESTGPLHGGLDKIDSDYKVFKFSHINPYSRRHPFIATLEHDSVSILDSYDMPQNRTGVQHEGTIKTNSQLRALIIVSAAWVALCQGWSACFKFDSIAEQSESTSHVSTTSTPLLLSTNTVTTGSPSHSTSQKKQVQRSSATITCTHSEIAQHHATEPISVSRLYRSGNASQVRANSTGSLFMQRVSSKAYGSKPVQSKIATNMSIEAPSAIEDNQNKRPFYGTTAFTKLPPTPDQTAQTTPAQEQLVWAGTTGDCAKSPSPIPVARGRVPVNESGKRRHFRKLKRLWAGIHRMSCRV